MNYAAHDRGAIQLGHSKFRRGGSREADAGFPQMTFRYRIVKNLNPLYIAEFLADLLQKFLVHVVVQSIQDNVALRRNADVEFIDLKEISKEKHA